MERYTVQREGVWTLEAGEAALPKALERLARCENLLAGLEQEQAGGEDRHDEILYIKQFLEELKHDKVCSIRQVECVD